MTKKELAQAIKDFIATQDSTSKNEWYCTQSEMAEEVLTEFATYIKLPTVKAD